MTHRELCQELMQMEETLLIELLGVTSEEIVDAFDDLIAEQYSRLSAAFDDQEDAEEE